MPRGVPKAAAATRAPPPTRVVSSRSAKARANASILEHDTDIDALIRKHDKKGARGFAKLRKTAAQQEAMETASEHAKENRDDLVDPPATSKAAKPKRTAKAKSSKKTVSSEDAPSVPDASTPPSSPKKTVLGESNRVAVHSDRVSSDKREGPSSPQRLQSPVRRRLLSPKKRKHMPEIQVASFLENYDLEAENRLRIARKTLQITIDSARTQMHAKAIARLPRSVRLMRLGDFIHEFNADVQAAVERNAVVANRAREEAWEDEKLQRKRKEADLHPAGDDAEDGPVEGKGKLARLEKKEERKGVVSPPPSKRTTKSKKPVRKAAKGTRNALLSSPPLASTPPPRSPSKVKPPSSTSFTPHLAPGVQGAMPGQARTPATGKARTARPSEQVQWLSLNGSPIIGIVAPDGTVHAMPRTLRTAATPVRAKAKPARNWDVIEDENGSDPEQDAETSATQLLELAKGIDERTRHKSAKATASANPSPISRSRRETLDGYDSDEGGSVFEEARSRPGDSQEPSLLHDGDDSSLPDEEAYMAQVMREEEQKRSRMLASEPRIARSSTSIKFGSRSSGESSVGGAAGAARASHSTIRAVPSGGKSSHKLSSSSNGASRLPSSPMVRNKASASRITSSSSSASTSSSPSKGRVSIVFASGSSHRMTNLSVESLMRLPSHERDQMIDILEKLKQAQSLAAS